MNEKEVTAPKQTPFTAIDKHRFKLQLQLWRPGLRNARTSEEVDFDDLVRANWYEATLEGVTFGEEWREYNVQYIGWSLDWKAAQGVPAVWLIKNTYAIGIKTPEHPDKPVLLCALRIHHKRSPAFAEILLPSGDNSHDSLDSLQNIQLCKSRTEIARAMKGFELFKVMQKQRGPKPLFESKADLEEAVIQAGKSVAARKSAFTLAEVANEPPLSISERYLHKLNEPHGLNLKLLSGSRRDDSHQK